MSRSILGPCEEMPHFVFSSSICFARSLLFVPIIAYKYLPLYLSMHNVYINYKP